MLLKKIIAIGSLAGIGCVLLMNCRHESCVEDTYELCVKNLPGSLEPVWITSGYPVIAYRPVRSTDRRIGLFEQYVSWWCVKGGIVVCAIAEQPHRRELDVGKHG